ncbi:DUF2911 domain-containing protein [Flavihumibacter petaseus]|nr:DUF2911 domain-containing protein [Flavihumibacter petaseus]
MKYLILAVIAIGSLLPAKAQEARKSPHDTVSNGNITVTYGRPYKKGRDIFGGLEAYGKVWRLGADEATTITFAKDGSFGGKAVKAGTYTLFATPDKKEWTFILNSQLGQWGAYDYDKNKGKDVLQVKAPSKALSSPVEQLTIRLDGKNMIVEWDKTQVTVPAS